MQLIAGGVAHRDFRLIRAQRLFVSDPADVNFTVCPGNDFRHLRIAAVGDELGEQRLRRHRFRGANENAVTLEIIHQRHGQLRGGQDAPRAHGNDRGVGGQHVVTDSNARDFRSAGAKLKSSNFAMLQLCTLGDGCIQQRAGEAFRVHLCRGGFTTQLRVNGSVPVKSAR